MANIADVIEKVRKLRALAAGATTMAEAEAAMAQAEAIIAKYRLAEADLAAERSDETPIAEDADPLWIGSRDQSWRSVLASKLSKHYGCFVFIRRHHGVRYHAVGQPNDLAILRYMFAWISAEIDRLAQNERGRSARNSFRAGAVTGVARTLAQSHATLAQEASGRAAIVLMDRHAAAEKWTNSAYKISAASSSSFRPDAAAFDRGVRAGERIHLGAALPGAVRGLPQGGGADAT